VKSILAGFKRSKNATLTISLVLNFEFFGILDIFKREIPKNHNLRPPKLLKWQFLTFRNQQLDFTENKSGRRIAEFSHCAK